MHGFITLGIIHEYFQLLFGFNVLGHIHFLVHFQNKSDILTVASIAILVDFLQTIPISRDHEHGEGAGEGDLGRGLGGGLGGKIGGMELG